MLSEGNIFPRWAPSLNNGYGFPLFTFQYPFPNLIGSFFHFIGFSFVRSVPLTLALGYTLALFFSYRWLRTLVTARTAALGTLTGAFVPYWFVDLYVRGSVGEVWAIAWVFSSLGSIVLGDMYYLSITVGLLIISHNILAMLFVPLLMLYAFCKRKRSVWFILLGIGISSWFWIPALYEQRYITGISTVNIFDHFPQLFQLLIPSWGTGFRGETTGATEMSYQIGIVPLLLFFFATVLFLMKKNIRTIEVKLSLLGVVMMMFFLQPMSFGIWKFLPILQFVQYPWRLLSLLLITTPLLSTIIIKQFKFGWLIAVVAVIVTVGYTRPVTYEARPDAHYLSDPSFTKGSSSLGNAFTTRWMNGKHVSKERIFSIDHGRIQLMKASSISYTLNISAPTESRVTIPVAYYPGWTVSLDKKIISSEPDKNGLLTFLVPQGSYVTNLYLKFTTLQKMSVALSILCLSLSTLLYILKKSV